MIKLKKYNLIVDGFRGNNFAAIVREADNVKVIPFCPAAIEWSESLGDDCSEFSIEANLPEAMFISEEKILTHTAETKILLMANRDDKAREPLSQISQSLNVKSFLTESTRVNADARKNVYGMSLSYLPKGSKKKIVNFKASKAKASSSAISMLNQAKKSKFRKTKTRERFAFSGEAQHVSPFNGYVSKSLERRVGKMLDLHLVAKSGNRASRRSNTLSTLGRNDEYIDLSQRISTVIKFKANRFS